MMSRKMLAALAAAVMCAGCATGTEPVTATPSESGRAGWDVGEPYPSEATPYTPPAAASPTVVIPDVFPKGYPKVVKLQTLPDQVAYYMLEVEKLPGSTKVIAVAPGVWTERIPGLELRQNAAEGSYMGYCAAIKAQNRRLEAVGRQASGYTCY